MCVWGAAAPACAVLRVIGVYGVYQSLGYIPESGVYRIWSVLCARGGLRLRFSADAHYAQDGETALMEASHYGNLEVVRILLAAGTKKEAKNWVSGCVWWGGLTERRQRGARGVHCVHPCDSG